ncbi:SRPBCC family protein [Terrimonas ferruginea]|uniref:SRPBCC family protein n=1 Tax=Terrimonas ferruginea TaxID=249 RepID=UPI0004155F55|nr:SRPBCC family protein [Terrimonas ferruginea]
MATQQQSITIETTVNAPVEKVWEIWNKPEHIIQWNSASPDWHTPSAENDLRVGGQLKSRMEARDGSMGFDFAGTYTEVKENEKIAYTLGDGRKVEIIFTAVEGGTHVKETFDAENQNSLEMQRMGWQAILDSFRAYAEKAH